MLSLALAALLCLQEDDPVKKSQEEVEKLLKRLSAIGPVGVGGVNECLGAVHQSSNQQVAAKRYKESADLILAAFETLSKAIQALETKPPDVRKMLFQIEKGRKRAAEAADDEARSGTLRYAIERCKLVWREESNAAAALFNLGVECFADGNVAEAEDALSDAATRLPSLRATTAEATAEGARLAPIMLARVRCFRGKYKEAAADLRLGLVLSPEWGDQELEYVKLHRKEGEYPKFLKKLQEYCELNADDKDAQLLLAHEKFFSDKRKEARKPLELLLKADPKDGAAKYFLERLGEE